jgi:hypothetical protein
MNRPYEREDNNMAGAWKLYTRAKRSLGTGGTACGSGGITLGAGVFKLTLHRASASANILKITNGGISTYASVLGECSARGRYVVGGLAIGPAAGKWTVGASTKAMKFTYTTIGWVVTASGSTIQNIKYAVIRTSTGATAGKVVCYCTLTTTAFNLTSPNTLTIIPDANGVFALA